MRTPRQTEILRALLHVLSLVPADYLIWDRRLKSEAASEVFPPPRPTEAELEAEVRDADARGLIVSVVGEDAVQRKITVAGRAWLAEHS